ncbi:MAG: LamG-like jellyroll fold domain-containing protein, partial [Chthoniobacteraceae bacterium]
MFNFHHWHGSLVDFPALFTRMQPYLLAVNLNGMRADTTQYSGVRFVGTDESELAMMRVVAESGWRGPVGIINEHGDLDAADALARNLRGIAWIQKEMRQSGSGGPKPQEPAIAPMSQIQAARGEPSVSKAFGMALAGGMLTGGKAAYHEFPITVECRAKLNSARDFNILVASDPKQSAEHWELYSFAGSGLLSIYQPGRGGSVSADVNICDGKWHALAAVLDASRVRLFVDGKLVKDAPCKPLTGQAVAGGLAIGRLVEGKLGCDGLIDDVRISKGVREIAAPGDAPLQRDAQTISIWNFDDLTAANASVRTAETGRPATAGKMPVPHQDGSSVPQQPVPREQIPDEWIIPAAKTEDLTRANGWPAMDTFKRWDRSLGGPTSNRFSALTQINKANVSQLKVAWEYHSKDGTANIQCNPIIVDGVMFAPTAGWNIVALDASNGKELWRFSPVKEGRRLEDQPARRGLLWWPGDAKNPARVIFGKGNWLYALDPKTGKVLDFFGDHGRTWIPMQTSTVGAVYRHVLVAAGYAGDVYGYDIRTGAMLWTFKTKPDAGEYGHDTWSNIEQGANCWGGMALDESRGIAYVATGSPKPNYIGMGHTGDNLFGDCVIALDALTGKRLWHFQEIRHDVWDWDIPAPPNLVTVERNGVRVDAVAQVTKLGNTLLLDRVTGAPLFDFRLVKVNTRLLPGDIAAPMQPMPLLPQPFARQAYTMAELPASPEAQAVVLPVVQRANSGPYPSIEEAKPTLLFNIHGGAEWTGASSDPRNGRLFVTSNEIPWFVTCFRDV